MLISVIRAAWRLLTATESLLCSVALKQNPGLKIPM